MPESSFFQMSIDMRKGIEGLSALVEGSFKGELMSGAYFVFVNKMKDRIKILYWDVDGFAIWWKRLEKGKLAWFKNNQNQVTQDDQESAHFQACFSHECD